MISDGLSPDLYWARFLPPCLSTIDADWLKNNVPKDASWSALRDAFSDQFGDPYKIDRLIIEISHARCGPRESPADFCARYQKLAMQAGVPGDDILAARMLKTKLPDHLELQVATAISCGQIPKWSIAEITRFVRSIPANMSIASHTATVATAESGRAAASSHGRPYCSIHRRHGHATADCHRRNRDNQGDGDKPSHMTSHSGGQNPPAARPNRCFKCNWVGGHSNSCPMIQGSSSSKSSYAAYKRRFNREPRGATNGGSEDQDQRQVHAMFSPGATEDIKKMFTIPVAVNGVKAIGMIDTGADCTC